LEMVQGSENMTIIDSLVDFGDTELAARGRIMSTDTCTFTVDRSAEIYPDEIVWKLRCEKVLTGQQMELTVAGIESPSPASLSDDFMTEGRSDFADLSALAGQWLWTGPAGGIDADSVADGTVNLADFAKFADDWIEK